MGAQAIAAAPVTCELCHVGLAGHDMLKQHCDRKHCSLPEYRKRTFYKAREAGFTPLLPWVKRSMVQSFQFFRLHSVPSSCNGWTMKATQEAVLRKEEGNIRKIVCKFNMFPEREMVRRQRINLEGTAYFLHEQFPQEVIDKRRKLLPKMKDAQKDGKRAWISYDSLYIDGKLVKP